jgi:hypothetical protein
MWKLAKFAKIQVPKKQWIGEECEYWQSLPKYKFLKTW